MQDTQTAAGSELLRDLDDYFCKKFTDFDMIGAMPSYQSVTLSMILKNKNRIEDGEYAANEMRKISFQPEAAKVLAELKERYVDNTFTFSFRPGTLRERLAALFGRSASGRFIEKLIRSYGELPAPLWEKLGIAQKDWKAVLRGFYIPEKVLVYKLTLLLGLSQGDHAALMRVCGASADLADARDVVMRYLVDYRVYNRDMIAAAFKEYRLRPIV